MSGADGNDIESLVFAGMIPVYALELVCVTYYALGLPEWWASRYVFVAWLWIILIQWWPWPWPSKEAETTKQSG